MSETGFSGGSTGQGSSADGKDPGALRTIGEVAKALGIRQHVLRYWEEQFPTLRPLKRSGGRRYYRPEDIALVETIDRLVHREGYTLKGARQALQIKVRALGKTAGGASEGELVPAALTASETVPPLAHLIALRNTLAGALNEA